MKYTGLRFLLIVSSLLLCACGENGIYSGKIILNGDLDIPAGVVEVSNILLIDGNLNLAEGGVIQGNVYQILGTLDLDGTVDGNVVQFNGVLKLGEEAQILGNLQIGGGSLDGSAKQTVTGEITDSQVHIPFSPEWFSESYNRQFGWVIVETLILTLLAVFLATVFPAPLGRISMAVGNHTLISSAMGLLVGIVSLSLVVQMIFTILLIPVSILGVLLIFLAIGVGWSGFGLMVGQRVKRKLKANWRPQLTAGLGTFVFMGIMNGFELLPGMGDIFSITTAIIGIGAVFLTRFGARRFIPASLDE